MFLLVYLQARLIYRAHSEDTFPLKQEVEDIIRDAEDISMHVFYSVNDAGEDVSNEYSADSLQSLIPDKKSLFYLHHTLFMVFSLLE